MYCGLSSKLSCRYHQCCGAITSAILIIIVVAIQIVYIFTFTVQSLIDSQIIDSKLKINTTAFSSTKVSNYKVVYHTVWHAFSELLQTGEFTALIVSTNIFWLDRKDKETICKDVFGVAIRIIFCENTCRSEGYNCCNTCIHHKKRIVAVCMSIVLAVLVLGLFVINSICICKECHLQSLTNKTWVSLDLVFTSLHLFIDCTIWIFVTGLVFKYIDEWNHEKLSQGNSPDMNTALYHKIGDSTRPIRDTLQAWFVLQYLAFLMYIYTDISHILLQYKDEHPVKHDRLFITFEYILLLLYDILGFVFSYMLALWMVKAHRQYYAEMNEKDGSQHLTPSPKRSNVAGYQSLDQGITLEYLPQSCQDSSRDLEASPLHHSEETLMADILKRFEIIKSKTEFCEEYDFCPSIFDISIPLNSPGYMVSVLLAMFALVIPITQ